MKGTSHCCRAQICKQSWHYVLLLSSGGDYKVSVAKAVAVCVLLGEVALDIGVIRLALAKGQEEEEEVL